MQSPGPTDVPFKYRGWAADFCAGPEGARFNYEDEVGLERAQNAEALLLGRVTHEAMHAFWSTAEGELADRLNELRKYVVSSTLTDPVWNATVLGNDRREQVARLREGDGEILVSGSRRLSEALIAMGLVDERRPGALMRRGRESATARPSGARSRSRDRGLGHASPPGRRPDSRRAGPAGRRPPLAARSGRSVQDASVEQSHAAARR